MIKLSFWWKNLKIGINSEESHTWNSKSSKDTQQICVINKLEFKSLFTENLEELFYSSWEK